MSVFGSIAFDDIKSVNQLTHIIGVSFSICQEEFLEFRILLSFKVRRVETDLFAVFKQLY